MAQDNSFDIVSKVDIQEVRNAMDQAIKEIREERGLAQEPERWQGGARGRVERAGEEQPSAGHPDG